MDDVRTNQEMASPRPARAKRLERALVAQYIHDLSERHRPNTATRSSGRAVPPPTESGEDT
jgi:hypothetical protein